MEIISLEMRMNESLKPHLLRVEAINLDNFISDNDDLSTIRGGGLLVLNVHRLLAGLPIPGILPQTGVLVPVADKDDGDARFDVSLDDADANGGTGGVPTVRLRLFSSGASIVVYSFDATEQQASRLRGTIDAFLRAKHESLRYATFAVQVAPVLDGDFCKTSEQLAMKVRLQQMRYPNLVMGKLHTEVTHEGSNGGVYSHFCDIDGKRAGTDDLAGLAKAEDKNFGSIVTVKRLAFGRESKVRVYQMLGGKGEQFQPTWDFDELTRRSHGSRVDRSADSVGQDPYGGLDGKMAVIYIDGNRFSGMIRELATDAQRYQRIDHEIQSYRRRLVQALVQYAQGDTRTYWRTKPDGQGGSGEKVRIETLMWGG